MEAVTQAPVRSRREVTIWSVGASLGVWLFALGVAGLAGATGDPAKLAFPGWLVWRATEPDHAIALGQP